MTSRRRWLILGGLLVATMAAAWKEMEGGDEVPARAARAPVESSAPRQPARQPGVRLEKLAPRNPGELVRDPFADGPAREVESPVSAARPRQRDARPRTPEAPPQPFVFAGRLESDGATAIFLTDGDRNLVVREGDTIDDTYRVERIAEDAITFVYLPLNQRQVVAISEPAQ